MNPEFNRLQHKHEQEEELEQRSSHETSSSQGAEFETVEELIRHDVSQVEVPPEIAIRLNESIAAEPKGEKPWFKKLFGT
ncbi:MAG: hypothetical protein ACO1QB_03550 [Verrucomicrobiales bacterium]